MAINLGYGDGLLFKILGKVAAVIKNQGSNVTTQNAAMSSVTSGIVGQLAAEPDVQAIIGSGYLGALSSLGGSVGPLMQQVATAALNRVVYRDVPRAGQTLTTTQTLACLQELIRQMRDAGASVRACTITTTPGSFSGGGDARFNLSAKRPSDGATLENTFSEILTALCVADSYVGGATSGNESIRITGGGAEPDVFGSAWPSGSGCDQSVNCIDGSADNSSGNLLTNSGWESWSSGVPVGWEAVTGGALISQSGGISYDGLYSLQLTGDGTTQLRLRQLFGTGTPGTLLPLAQCSFCGWARRDGTVPGAGVLKVSLKDVNGGVIKDAALVDNSVIQALTALTTDWVPFVASFRTPLILPDAYYLEIETTTALSAGRSVYLDRFGLGAMNQLYIHGPFAAVHSGATPLRADARATATVVNGRGAGGTLDTWQTGLYRLFLDVQSNELLFPSSASNTIDDAWIT